MTDRLKKEVIARIIRAEYLEVGGGEKPVKKQPSTGHRPGSKKLVKKPAASGHGGEKPVKKQPSTGHRPGRK